MVVIPSYLAPDNGKARIIALKGVDDNTYVWSNTVTDTLLPNLNAVPTTYNTDSIASYTNTWGRLPSDYFTGDQSFVDPNAKYRSGWNEYYIPSPYLADGTLNPEYIKSSLSNNALSDFNGKSNTDYLVSLGSDYVAANAAKNYSVDNIDINWYLPAAGELGFLPVRYRTINDSINICGGTPIPLSAFWSSSEFSASHNCSIDTSGGGVGDRHKNTKAFYVRPFAQLDY